MSDTKVTNGDLAGMTAREKRDVYVEIGKILSATGLETFNARERDGHNASWGKRAQERLREELGIKLYRRGEEIPGGVDSNFVEAYVEAPDSIAICEDLNAISALACEHERRPCVSACGVFLDPITGLWRPIPTEWRLDWLATVNWRTPGFREPGPRLLHLVGAERLSDGWLSRSTSLFRKLRGDL